MSILLSTRFLVLVSAAILLSAFYVPKEVLELYWGDQRVLSFGTVVWIAACMLAFWMGSFVERSLYVDRKPQTASPPEPWASPDQIERTLVQIKGLLWLAGAVILARFLWSVTLVGGLGATFQMMVFEPEQFKFTYWQNTNIHGVGILAELIVATTIAAAAVLALVGLLRAQARNKRPAAEEATEYARIQRTARRLLWASLLILTFYLLASNERVPFVGGVLGSVLVYSLLQRRFPLKTLGWMAVLLACVWVLVEIGRSEMEGKAPLSAMLKLARDQLVLYFAAGLRNVDTIVHYIDDHTYGWFSFRFLLSPFKLDELIPLPTGFYAFNPYSIRPGYGAIPPFGTAFADFGLAGLAYFMFWGFVYQKLHRLALIQRSFVAVQIYAYFLAVLLTSFVTFLPNNSRFWVVVLGLYVLNKRVSFGGLPSFRVRPT